MWEVSSISYHFNLYSHPDKLLKDHLKNVAEMAFNFVHSKEIKDRALLEKIAYIIGIAHDFGKASTYFQEKLFKNKKTEKARHAQISAIWGYFIAKNFVETNKIEDNSIPILVYLVISRHHGDLRNLRGISGEKEALKEGKDLFLVQLDGIKENIEEVRKIYDVLCDKNWLNKGYCDIDYFFEDFDNIRRDIIREIRRLGSGNVHFYLRLIFLYSILLDADKIDASNSTLPERMDIPSDIVDRYKKIKFDKNKTNMDKVREEIYKETISFANNFDPYTNKIMSVELPTGSGKTLTGLSLALKLRKKIKNQIGITPRIIYSLPFLSIIDQNHHVFGEVLYGVVGDNWEEILSMDTSAKSEIINNKVPSNLLLVHHHLADIMYETEEEEYNASKSRILTEGWNSEVIITTFFQVMHTLITYRNSAARKFHKIANSILILDEVQNIPYKYWKITNEILRILAEEYNVWVILMTATMPLIFQPGESINIIKNPGKYYEFFNRSRYTVEERVDFDGFADRIWAAIKSTKDDIFVILNKVQAVKDLYIEFRERLGGGFVDENGVYWNNEHKLKLVNLTTHIIPNHRFKRIAEIKRDDGYRKILISTQLVEAGVDISAKKVFRDIAPMDSVFQSGGRCNRSYEYGMLGGEVHLTNILKEGKPLWRNVYDSVLIDATNQILKKNRVFEEREIRKIIRDYYTHLVGITAKDHKVEDAIKNHNYGDLREFRLIEENYPKEEVFIEIDENAKNVFEKYLKLKEIDNPFERKNKFLEFKREFYDYVISVPAEIIKRLGLSQEGEIYVVYHNDIGNIYNLETGIRINDNSLIF